MTAVRRTEFSHEGHHFEVLERSTETTAGPSASSGDAHVRLVVRMDGEQVLEFEGPYPYRSEDVRERVLEWYGIQQPLREPPRA